jgi:hypothetical protein
VSLAQPSAYWWSAYAHGGLEALPHGRTGRPFGSGRVLDDAQARHLQGLIDVHSPEAVGIAAPFWTRRPVCGSRYVSIRIAGTIGFTFPYGCS